jgi:hypothetical protein
MQDTLCGDRDHASRVGQPGHQDIVGRRGDRDPDDGSLICDACARARQSTAPPTPEQGIEAAARAAGLTRDQYVIAVKAAVAAPDPAAKPGLLSKLFSK